MYGKFQSLQIKQKECSDRLIFQGKVKNIDAMEL